MDDKKNGRVWDVALTPKQTGQFSVTLPAAIGKALFEHKLNRGTLSFDEDGIHIKPYVGPEQRVRDRDVIEVPASWMEA